MISWLARAVTYWLYGAKWVWVFRTGPGDDGSIPDDKLLIRYTVTMDYVRPANWWEVLGNCHAEIMAKARLNNWVLIRSPYSGRMGSDV